MHRDVKPSNILFIGGEPKLADAGLVAAVDDAQSLVGTAGYIAPEGPGAPQADLYALGKVLYEAAFGKDRQEFPALPADIASRPDHARSLELNAILLKACAIDPRQRYECAGQMQGDLKLLQAGYSVKRRQARQRSWSYAKRVGLTVGAVAALLAVASWLSLGRARSSDSTAWHPPEFTWSTNEAANQQFTMGRDFLHIRGDSLEAIKHLQQATELDPNFADAYALLARAWNTTGTASDAPKARLAAEKAVSLNTNCPLGNSVLATGKLFDLDWPGADVSRMRARALAPNSEDVLLTSALNLAVMGRAKDALADLEKALRAAPTSASNLRKLSAGLVYAWSGQYDRAIEIFEQVAGDGPWGKHQFALAYLGKGDYPNAIRLERQAALVSGGDPREANQEFDGPGEGL